MAVECATYRISHGFVVIITFDEHGKNPGNGATPLGTGASTLQNLGQGAEHARRKAARDRWFTPCKRQLTESLRVTRQRIHHQKDILPLIAKPFCDGCSEQGSALAHRCRFVAGRNNHDGF